LSNSFFELALKKEAGMMDTIWFVIFLARMGGDGLA